MTWEDLSKKIVYLNDLDQKLIHRAFDFAKKAHEGQLRKTGEPFIEHSLQTAAFVADLKLDAQAVSAALLHDVEEDTTFNLNQIRHEFGKTIAALVDGVTKLGKVRITRKWLFLTDEKELKEYDRQVETLRKMLVAMARDIRVILIKLADRYHNMKTLEGVEATKRERIARETLEIYAPLAYRLGMGELKGLLEDLAFKYLYPEEYETLAKRIAAHLKQKSTRLDKIRKKLMIELAKEGIRAEVHGRAKHIYSLWRKLKKHDNDLAQIYDLVALRVIVDSVESCYKALGVIHKTWKPLVGRIKDYIAMPKPNGYQSLHTTVFADNGEILEVQVRTKQMHEHAENGIAAHWKYSEGKNTFQNFFRNLHSVVPSKELAWVNELARIQQVLTSNKEMSESLALDFFSDRIFIFTPTGDVKNLPSGATPIDFAYAIHTDLGHCIIGAKVNGKLVELSSHLKNGDIVEILTKKNSKPKRDWLEFVKTSGAKSKIRAALKIDLPKAG